MRRTSGAWRTFNNDIEVEFITLLKENEMPKVIGGYNNSHDFDLSTESDYHYEDKVKKKFEVRPGNSNKDSINEYLQDISFSNKNSSNDVVINNNSTTNINQLNLQNYNKIQLLFNSINCAFISSE